ncbi:acyl--CoA ligase [Aestuariicella hydrocarbonica]|uniref:Acyl--CoA ligase n=1 Tax=Pseudomaricurvus hydrocarbonicus TaxID=1470433 RepID=A0A9E5JVI9_9GAMM|nr:class I adenylate-forming enzyme family protein [Aestuariicella hydrocarbonica]NHO66019.1 acyl--CoA ligase [Aestuariicella hydrocarbonica]
MSQQNIKNEQALSIFQGPPLAEDILGSLTLGGFMAEVAQKFGDNEALCWKDLSGQVRRWSYNEMHAECRKVASALLAAGVAKDTRVGVLISNRPEWVFSTFGAAMAGAVVVALNTFSTQQELHYQLKTADVEVLILETGVASKKFVEDVHAIIPQVAGSTPGQLMAEELPFLRRVINIDADATDKGIQGWMEFLAQGERVPAAMVDATIEAACPLDRALIFFSSGSTALPKAIQQTQRAAMMQCWRFGRYYQADSSARVWSANGFFFSGNFCMAFGSAFTVGGCLVLQRFFDPEEALQLFLDEKVSMPHLWPHQEARLTECPGWLEADLSTLTHVDQNLILATHPSINSTWRQPNGYGMTETFTFVVGGVGSDITNGSNGAVLNGNTVKIVDQDTGEILPIGETGEIVVKGPTLTAGYLKIAPEDTFDAEGFIHTADAGYFNEEGHLFWKGRLGDIIKTGGANVSPAEIDAVLMQHEAIQSVFTVGVEHDTLGEIVVSCVLLSEGKELDEAGLRAFAKQSLASYKIPRRVLFFSEEELPMTGSNKIRRPELKKLVVERMAAEQA